MKNNFLFYGDDIDSITYRISELIQKLNIDEKVNAETTRIVTQEDYEVFVSRLANLSVFANESVSVIYLNHKSIKSVEQNMEYFMNLLNTASKIKSFFFVVLFEKYDKSTTKSFFESIFSKEVSKSSVVEEHIKLKYWQVDKIKNKINKLAAKYQLQIEDAAIDLLVESFKNDNFNLNSELERIQTYILPSTIVTSKTIKEFYLDSPTIDDLYNMLINYREDKTTLQMNSKLSQPLYLIAVLQAKLRQALYIKTYLDANFQVNRISILTGLNTYKIEKEIPKLKNISTVNLKNMILKLSDIELKIKSGIIRDKNFLDILLISSK